MKDKDVIQVRKQLIDLGDSTKAIYDEKKDLKAALIAVRAYGEATRTAIAQIRYKQLTASPTKIEFLEED